MTTRLAWLDTVFETPESLMRQVVREEAGSVIAEAILAMQQQTQQGHIFFLHSTEISLSQTSILICSAKRQTQQDSMYSSGCR